MNANTIVLIPKVSNVDIVDQFGHIAITNFNYRLAQIMPYFVSAEQKGFIKGRHIGDF